MMKKTVESEKLKMENGQRSTERSRSMPKGWVVKKLGEVCDFQNGFAFKSKTYKDKGVPVVRITNIQDEKIDLSKIVYINPKDYNKDLSKYKIIKGDLLIAMSGATTGKIGIHKTDEILLLNQRVGKFYPKKGLNKAYLLNYLKTKVEESLAISAGATQPNLSTQQIKDFKIPLPPLPQQKQIVKILDQAFTAIDKAKNNAQQNLLNAKQLFESYLQNVFENKGEDWVEKSLGEVCSLFQGLAINRKTKHFLVEKSNLPLLRIKDLRKNTAEQYVDENNYPKNALVNEDDIIYTRTGNSLGLVFRGRYGILHNNSFKIVPNDILSRDYLFIWLQNPLFKSKIFGLAFKAAQPDITHKIFKSQRIKIPPIQEQQKIVKKLNALQTQTKKLETIYEQKIADLEELKKSILQRAFNGQLLIAND